MTNSYLHLIHEEYSQTGIPFNNKWNIIFQSILRDVLKRIVKQTNRQYLHTFKFSLFFNTRQNNENKTLCFNLISRFSRNYVFSNWSLFLTSCLTCGSYKTILIPLKRSFFPSSRKVEVCSKAFQEKTLLTLNDNRRSIKKGE